MQRWTMARRGSKKVVEADVAIFRQTLQISDKNIMGAQNFSFCPQNLPKI